MAQARISDLSPVGAVAADSLFEVETRAPASGKATGAQVAAFVSAQMTAGASATYDTFAEVEARIGERLPKAGGSMAGPLELAASVDVASATTTDIGAAASNIVRITGTTTITGLGTIASGALRFVTFAGPLTLTHDATNLILPGGTNILTAANDSALFVSTGAGHWRCLFYQSGGWTSWSPTVSATTPAGSGFVATVSFARYEKRGRTVHAQFLISISNLGTGPAASGNITVTLPFNAANASICTGGEYGVTSKGVQGSVTAGSNVLSLRLTDGTATAVAGYQFRVQMTYETAA